MVFPDTTAHFTNSRQLIQGRMKVLGNANFLVLIIIFLLFAANGPAFSFAGQLRYLEAVLLVVGLFFYDKYTSRVDRLEWQLSGLFLLTAIFQFISNTVNHAPDNSTISRVGTYLLLAVLIPIVAVLINRDWRRLLAAIFGYCCSFVIVAWTGTAVSATYDELPWRLGLGAAFTFALVALFGVFPRVRLLLTLAMFALAAAHIYFESRALAAITLLVAFYCLIATFGGRNYPAAFKVKSFSAVILVLGVVAYTGPLFLKWMAEANLLPQSSITKNELQAANTYGFLAAARPDTFTALYAISKKPLLGYGSGVFDAEVFSFYAEVNAASYRDAHVSRSVFKAIYKQDWSLGIPSHSHIFGAWADAGIFAALSWFFVLWIDLKMLARLWRWGHPMAPLFVFVGVATFWDVLFSPGPLRLDIAIRVVIMATAFRYFKLHDVGMRQMQKSKVPL